MDSWKETAGQKIEGAKEFVSEKAGVIQSKIPTAPAIPEIQSTKSSEVVDDINTIPLPVEVTLVPKDTAVVVESIPNFTEPSKEGEWEEVKNYHTIVEEIKSEKLSESMDVKEQPIVEKEQEPVKMVPVDETAIPQTEGALWPKAESITLSTETAWTNPQKTKEIVQNLTSETSAVLAEERK